MYNPIVKDLVLVGGGHSHVIVLKMLGMHPIPGVRLTLITDASDTPYSGMLPGHIAGFYSRDECHIDLRSLAHFAQAQLYLDRVVGLDLTNNQVICASRPAVSFDVLSIDIGSTPATISVPGAADYTIPAKPVAQLLTYWEKLTQDFASNPQQAAKIAIVGGGIGGVELALSMQANLHRLISQAVGEQGIRNHQNLEIHLFQRHPQLMPNNHQMVRRQIQKILQERHVQLHLGENVVQIEPQNKSIDRLRLRCESGFTGEYAHIFWVTQASAPAWLQASGLKTDPRGFILVDDTLQSLSHPQIFAAGDIATMVNHPRPKAGVFAVRQGKPLFTNLQRLLLGKSLQPYTPQKQYLRLIGTGDGKGIANRGIFYLPPHELIWRWKDWIDRRFMERFRNFPRMQGKKRTALPNSGMNLSRAKTQRRKEFLFNWIEKCKVIFLFGNAKKAVPIQNSIMPCAGCGSKVGSAVLTKVLQRIQSAQGIVEKKRDIMIGLDAADDGAVIRVRGNQVLVQTIDYFRALINDPYIFGKIAANHCLSDIFAMGATPHSALAIATIPYGIPSKVEETLYQLLSGAVQVLNETGTSLIGGHTTEGAEIGFGLSCNGFADADKLLRKGGMEPGDVLILTKALGTGTLFAAEMGQKAKGRWIDGAVESMLLSNQLAAECLLQYSASACTDVTGFGLLGHLLEMLQASGAGVELQLEHLPILTGARETIAQGIFSSLHPENLQVSRYISNQESVSHHAHYPLLFDPQTAGGLLASVPADKANDCIAQLKALGYRDSCAIARIIPLVDHFIRILC